MKDHPYFESINFETLTTLKVDFEGLPPRVDFKNTSIEFDSCPQIVYEGILIKVNRFYMRQVRHFVLYSSGEVKYFKNLTEYKGQFWLTKDTKVSKTKRSSFEIRLSHRTYYL